MLNLLIKPASGSCNLNCKYCFYHDLMENREKKNMGRMSLKTLEELVKSAFLQEDEAVAFAFQGGEPTLVGLDFYKALISYQKQYNTKKIAVHNSIQTNAMVIDEEWARFLADNNFLVGISLDGDSQSHNIHRGNSFHQVMRAIRLFNKYNTQYNILCVVTANTVRHIEKIYNFYKKNNFKYLQFIPCLDGLNEERGKNPYSLTPKLYEKFLIRLFDLWYNDLANGNYISIRHFDNFVSMLMGNPPESCSMNGICSCQFVVEADGGIYPCDFYVIDKYKIGKVGDSFKEMAEGEVSRSFIEKSVYVPPECKSCEYAFICRNGCRRDRIEGKNYFCQSCKAFFDHALGRLHQVARAFSKSR